MPVRWNSTHYIVYQKADLVCTIQRRRRPKRYCWLVLTREEEKRSGKLSKSSCGWPKASFLC